MEYGKALRAVLEMQGMSQADLARAIGKSTAYVSQLCSGKIKEPTISKALDIAKACGVDIDVFASLMQDE